MMIANMSKSYLTICPLLVIISSLLGFARANQPESFERDEHVLLSPDLVDRPESLYTELKKYLQDEQETDPDSKVEGLGSLTIRQVVGACGSIEGDCDISDLGRLDDELYFNHGEITGSPWTQYSIYCREQWLSKCNPTDEMSKRIADSFTWTEWLNTKNLVDSVLREPPAKNDPQALNIHHRYPKGVVKFMQFKDGSLKEILKMRKGKWNLFQQRYDQLVKPVCEKVVSSLQHVVMGMKWADQGEMRHENPTIESGLKIFHICLKISAKEHELVGLCYDAFSGKKKNLMSKLKRKTLLGLGVKDGQ